MTSRQLSESSKTPQSSKVTSLGFFSLQGEKPAKIPEKKTGKTKEVK